MHDQYWLAQWIDENDIRFDWDIEQVLFHDMRTVEQLMELAAEAESRESKLPVPGALGESVVAGSRLDLSGNITCGGYECLLAEVESTFKHAWHYFDKIVVEGISPIRFDRHLRKYWGQPERIYMLLKKVQSQGRLLLNLREIGADKFIVFMTKPSLCKDHWLDRARELGVFDVFDGTKQEQIVNRVARHSTFDFEQTDVPPGWGVSISGEFFDEPIRYQVAQPERPSPEALVAGIVSDYAHATISDVELSRALGIPLIEPANMPWLNKGPRLKGASAQASVALELYLPFLDGISTKDFLKLRCDEQAYFERHRTALRNEIVRHLNASNAKKSPAAVAREIERDYLRPGLADIERRFKSSRKALGKNSSISLSICSATAIVGPLIAMPLLVGTGIAAASFVPIFQEYQRDRKAIESSEDLYFLWNVAKRSHHN